MSTFILRIKRGEGRRTSYFEEFECKRDTKKTLIAYLSEIQANPYMRNGVKTTPVAWDQSCLEEVCGSCSMLINGKPRQACSAIVETIILNTGTNVITLAPFSKFPRVRDLVINRDRMFDSLKKVQAWIEVDSYHSDKPGPKYSQKKQELMYNLSQCMVCGCCCEVCPKFGDNFMGAFAIGQSVQKQLHPSGSKNKLPLIAGDDGVTGCGKSNNCEKVCPKNIQLVEAISLAFRLTWKDFLGKIFRK